MRFKLFQKQRDACQGTDDMGWQEWWQLLELAGRRTQAHHFHIFSGMCLQISLTNQSPVWVKWNLPMVGILPQIAIFLPLATQKFQSIGDLRGPGDHIGQGLSNFYLGTKAGLPSVFFFVNKVLLEQKSCDFSHIFWTTTLGTIITKCHVDISC